MTLKYPRGGTVLGFKGQRSRSQDQQVNFFIYYDLTKTAIHRHSLGEVTSRLRFRGCLVRASLTFARWRDQSSIWDRTRNRVPSS